MHFIFRCRVIFQERFFYKRFIAVLEIVRQCIIVCTNIPCRTEVTDFKITGAKQVYRNIYKTIFLADVFHQLIKSNVCRQNIRISRQNQLFSGSCDSHIQFSVDDKFLFTERIGR